MRKGSLCALAAIGGVCLAMVGCAGDEGETGAPGATGPAGSPGTPGSVGPTGPAGSSAPTPTPPTEAPKAVYTLSNDATSNAVVVYTRAADGTLTPHDSYATGGRGSASGLGNQGALVFDKKTSMFYAINAGDNSISMMSLRIDGSLALVSKVASGGAMPISVTVSNDILYALNAGNATTPANIAGFKISRGGLTRVATANQPLSAAQPGPAQIEFTPDGKFLVVTEKGTNMIDTYAVTDGIAAAPKSQASSGTTPFGFAFSQSKHLIVSEAFGGADAASATSSYAIGDDGKITAKTASAASQQAAACWVAVAGNYAYVTNTRSHTVTAYSVGTDGALALLKGSGVAGQTGMNPIDLDASDDNTLLYTLNRGDRSLSIFTIAADGSLTKKPDFAGLPENATGLVVR
jgi:6-phosphogluconolactonase